MLVGALILGSATAARSAPPSSPGKPASSGAGNSTANGGRATTNRATFGIAPATPTRVDNRTEFSYVLAPTAHYDDYAAIRNFSAKPLTLTISAVDLGNDAAGNVEAGLNQSSAKDAGRWITFDHAPTLIVPGQGRTGPGQVIVPFHISVPANVSVGDHAAEILTTLTTLSRGKNSQNVLLKQRIGARVFIRVPGNPHAALAIRGLSVNYSGGFAYPLASGTLQVRYTIVNTGNVTLNVTQGAAISGWFGAHVSVPANQAPQLPVLLPGESAAMSYVIGDVPRAIVDHFTVTAKAAYGTDTTLNQARPTELGQVAPVSVSARFWAIPWLLILVVVALILLAIGFWWWRRRRRRDRQLPKHAARTKEFAATR